MSSAASSTKVSTPSAGAGARGTKPKSSKIVTLKLATEHLVDFLDDTEKAERKPSISKSSSSTSTVVPTKDSPESTQVKDETTPVPSADSTLLQVPVDGAKKKGLGGPKPGTKRPAAALSDGTPKPRTKAPPKKRARMDGTVGSDQQRPWTTPAPITGHKLGPKANQGAINAGLRALDRTGKPCRKWSKTGFTLKSFTGVEWYIHSWGAPKKEEAKVNGEEGQSSTPNSNSENQENPAPQSSSVVGSDTSRNPAVDIPPASSPAEVAVETPA